MDAVSACQSTQSITWLYLFGMGMMMIFSPIWAIITQLAAYFIIQKVRTWWTERKNKPYVVPADKTGGDQTLP